MDIGTPKKVDGRLQDLRLELHQMKPSLRREAGQQHVCHRTTADANEQHLWRGIAVEPTQGDHRHYLHELKRLNLVKYFLAFILAHHAYFRLRVLVKIERAKPVQRLLDGHLRSRD